MLGPHIQSQPCSGWVQVSLPCPPVLTLPLLLSSPGCCPCDLPSVSSFHCCQNSDLSEHCNSSGVCWALWILSKTTGSPVGAQLESCCWGASAVETHYRIQEERLKWQPNINFPVCIKALKQTSARQKNNHCYCYC